MGTIIENDFVTVDKIEEKKVCIITAKQDYIPIREFKQAFNTAGKFIKDKPVEKLIFDKRNLKVFDQPSMEWYFLEWKAEMKHYGLEKHRKLLPEDELFVESVKLGREKLLRENPDAIYHQLDIKYAGSNEDAIQN